MTLDTSLSDILHRSLGSVDNINRFQDDISNLKNRLDRLAFKVEVKLNDSISQTIGPFLDFRNRFLTVQGFIINEDTAAARDQWFPGGSNEDEIFPDYEGVSTPHWNYTELNNLFFYTADGEASYLGTAVVKLIDDDSNANAITYMWAQTGASPQQLKILCNSTVGGPRYFGAMLSIFASEQITP